VVNLREFERPGLCRRVALSSSPRCSLRQDRRDANETGTKGAQVIKELPLWIVRVDRDAPGPTVKSQDVEREGEDLGANEEEPELDLADALVEKVARDLGSPVVERAHAREHEGQSPPSGSAPRRSTCRG